jgi:hypothetical protein
MDGIASKTALNTGGKIYYALFHPCAASEAAPEIKTIYFALTCCLAGVHAVEIEVKWTFGFALENPVNEENTQ